VSRKYSPDTPPRTVFEQALRKYRELGLQLYGMRPLENSEMLNKSQQRGERKRAIMGRRVLETAFPRLREVAEEDYKGTPTKSRPAPRIFIEMAVDGRAGRIVYPDGSRSQYAVKAFASPDQMMDIIAELTYFGTIDPRETQVTVGGSAQPLLTFISDRG